MLSKNVRYSFYRLFSSHIFFANIVCQPWANIAQVISLCNVGPERCRQNYRLFSFGKLFVDCGSTFNIAQVISYAMLVQADQDNIL